MSEIINGFMERYNKEFDFYLNLSNKVEWEITNKLHSFGVRAIVSSRAKSPKRLREKIIDRNSRALYSSIDDIYKDIVDLAGVRVAIYFPGDMLKVDELIRSEFLLDEEPKTFPEKRRRPRTNNGYEKVFSGYAARHFRVKIKGNGRYSNNYPVEIQVASVLMHAWSEVEHDLVYKPLQGSLSDEELMILDEINGLVLSGNLALQRLQQAGIKRTEEDHYEFKNHYDLAAFFITHLNDESIDSINFNDIFKVLKNIGKTRKNDLLEVAGKIISSSSEKETLSRKKRKAKEPATFLYDEIITSIANSFPEETIFALEKNAEDIFGFIDLPASSIQGLIDSIIKHYICTDNMKQVASLVDNYDFYSEVIFSTKEESLEKLIESKEIILLKSLQETIEAFENYISTKKMLTPESFSKEVLNDLICQNEYIDSILAINKRE